MGAATINDTGEQLIGHVNEALGQSVASTDDTGETLIGHVNDALGVAGTAKVTDTGEVFIGHVNDALDHAGPKTIRVMTYNVARFVVDSPGDQQVDGNGYYANDDPGYYIGGTIQRQGAYNERYNAWSDLLNGVNPHVFVDIEHDPVFSKYNGTQYSASTILSPWKAQDAITNKGNHNKGIFCRLFEEYAPNAVNHYTFAADSNRNYIIADIDVNGVTVRFAVAHLTFSRQGQDASDGSKRYSEMDELMTACANYDHAVILGDFNVLKLNEYQRFVNNGYICANDGTLETFTGNLVNTNSDTRALDNIIVKGFTISNVTMPDAAIYRQINGNSVRYPLSDHNPIWCDLTFV